MCSKFNLELENLVDVLHAYYLDSKNPYACFIITNPMPNMTMQTQVMAPAVEGTLNVLRVCSSMKVQKVVVVSSTSALHFNPNWPKGKPKDESCWSDRKICIDHEVSDVKG